MIAVVGLLCPSSEVGVESLGALPPAPALRWDGFLLSSTIPLAEMVVWCASVRDVRPEVPIGLAGPASPEFVALIDSLRCLGLGLEPLALDSDYSGTASSSTIEEVRIRTVEATVRAEWLGEWGVLAPDVTQILSALCAVGVRGGGTKSVRVTISGGSVMSESSIRRRLREAGLPGPGQLLWRARHRAVTIRASLGMTEDVAILASGYSSVRAWKRACSRRFDQK